MSNRTNQLRHRRQAWYCLSKGSNSCGRACRSKKGFGECDLPYSIAALRWPPSLHFTKLYPLCPSGWSSLTKSSGNLSQSCRLRIFLYAEPTTPFEVRSSRTQRNNRNPSNITILSEIAYVPSNQTIEMPTRFSKTRKQYVSLLFQYHCPCSWHSLANRLQMSIAEAMSPPATAV